ncbi:stabilin-1 [Sebastes umbrosus]|uniref:stabilin-1 n=1 Tax=Sebastes umbrosus TaxID=72105 RepID=UPI00189E8D57|nr:stabilin-1 [Sebastes umbrosus]XP_037641906.1 stabilin-1 [Sebastes umbrosus]
MLLLLFLLLLCLQTSLQEQTAPPGRCDVSQREDVYTSCTSCAAASTTKCPHGFSNVGTTNCSYVVEIGGREMALDGCQHICVKGYMMPLCCSQHWGPLCFSCPSWSGKTCNFHGTCLDGGVGNGTCVCDDGFSGFACQECKNENFFGEKCDKECDCVHGVCKKGPEGDGQCLCQPPYTGKRCDQVSTRCSNCSPYSYCKGEGDAADCECLPGYKRGTLGKCASICSGRDCDVNAQCSSQGSRISCVCNPDYQGDGKICVPKNPCADNNGGCPINSTICVFNGPNKSVCECMFGMSPVGGNAQFGCELVSACSANTCDPTAICQTEVDGQPRCVCEAGQIGDGHRCYGNLMERLIELDRSGSQRENLTGAVALFEKGCSLLLSHNGPFTAFIPLLKTPLTGVNEELVCKNHLILGQHLYKDLEGRDFKLYGGATFRSKDNKKFILMDNPSRLYTVIQQDLPAANGIMHIIDQPITNTLPEKPPRDERFADKTIGEILAKDEKYSRFLSLVDNCGSPPNLRGPGPLTMFVPINQAVDRSRDGSFLYMLHDAKPKLQELVRHHIFSQAVLTVDELATLPQIQTMANQIVSITVSKDGEILLGEKGVQLATTNIVASNGIIHMIDGILYPPSILPILPHRCDVIESKITMSPCVHCLYLYQSNCPDGTITMQNHQTDCDYMTSRGTTHKGCAKYCNATKTEPECCKGFYGPDCKPCIGGFQHPCYDKGTCFDGIHGNGSCSCHSGLTGVACHICADRSKHGENCDEECHCVHGVCDNRPASGGVCRRGSCLEGYSGEKCDKTATPCNSDGLQEHCHIHAYCTQTGLQTKCLCRDGYEGDGHSCSPINPCLKNNRGGCHTNAECVYVGPGNASCVCIEGWKGDGRVCVEINNCQLESRGGCSPKGNCIYIGPGQSDCICKTGYSGNGIVCELVNPCYKKHGGCHELAKCEPSKDGGAHTCTCPDGYAGDGTICYGALLEELDMIVKLASFNLLTQKYSRFSEELNENVTLLVPSREAMRNMTSDQRSFWTTRHRLPHFLRAHFLQGIYSVEDLEGLVGSRLPTLNPNTYWEISNISGVLHIGNASILTPNLPAINGYIHIIDQILAPSSSDLPPEPHSLMAFLNSSSTFTLFRQHALMYNLSEDLQALGFTLLLPTDDAIRQHLNRTDSSLLDSDVFKYHVILNELLFPDHLSDGTLKSTLLGNDYQVQFHLNNNNQTVVNNVPLDGTFIETQRGVIIVLPQVLKIQRNRCSKQVYLQFNGRCTDCEGPPRCLFNYKPIKEKFPANMRSNCKYRKRIGSRRKSMPGCVVKCLGLTTDHSCCPGYYGHECFKCPGDVGSWCSNHGQCQDGNHGNGECRCFEGFHGTACEDCEPGRYGVNCSSKCVCAHGKCEDGLAGSGGCVCYKGWKGSSCSIEIKDDACGGVCDENANCITGPKGSAAACLCVAGYEGNGTYCNELDFCSRSNGGCSEFALCKKVSAGERTCTCIEGYTGDGVICLEIDGCLVNNGGCSKSAECTRTGPNITACRCMMGFQGSGRFCYAANPCRNLNGGCSRHARCEYLGQGQRNCSCLRGYVGDGFDCRGNTNNEMSRQPENGFFRRMSSQSGIGLYGEGPYTVFVPLEETNQDSSFEDWKLFGRISDLVRYHIVSCESLTLSDLKTTQLAVSTSGYTLHFSLQEGSVVINNRSRIVKSDYTTTNGIIHHIDTLLTPYRLQDKPNLRSSTMNLTSAAAFYGYSRFYKLIEDVGLLPVLQMSIHQPFTMFWPTDKALSSLPAERQHWLSSPEHQEQVAAVVKAHIIRNAKVMGLGQPDKYSTFRTMQGFTIKYSCDKTLVGAVLIDENAARVVERYLHFKEGVAYGIDQLLEPPGLGAICDNLENKTTKGRCGNCISPPSCPFRHQDMGTTEPCLNYRPSSSRYGRRYPSWHDLDDTFSRMGCKRVCQYKSWVQKCCKNHYGRDCQVCPGGLEAPCGNHGDCDDNMRGSGKCRCHEGFIGIACELCAVRHYGPNCTVCSCGRQGRCDEGIEGSGQCVCNAGWKGDQCQIDIGSIPEECRQCHAQADCVPDVGCQCKSGFEGNGTFCSPEPPPDLCSEYNGGCHQNADCNQTGLLVNCTCHSDYQGDGYSCEPINRCIEEQNGGCSDFASCKFTGPNERQCECLPGYLGNGVQCLEKLVPPVDRCLEDNGGCDPAAICKDLHYHANTAGVFHLRSPDGRYKMNFSQADTACQAEGATLASFKQLGDAQQLGMHRCVAGWIEGGKVGYPTRFPSANCGDNHVGLVIYKEPVDQSSKYDAYCYRLKDVSCACPAGYIGNGDFCNGVLTSVLATYSNFSIFYKLLLDYSGQSSEGKQLVEFMSHMKSEVTLFVPHNAGFAPNQTLSGRDLEYHISTNHSRRPFKDLRHQEVIKSRLGFNLTVTHGNNESSKMVNRRLLLVWDIPAVNGIIHVIEAPLTAPPEPIPHHATRGHASSSGTVSAILVSVLLACVLAALGYYVFKHKTDAFRFHYFRNEDEDGAAGGRMKPTLVSIPNPLYSGSRAFSEPFGDAGQGLEPLEPEEPPNILDLDQ